METINFLITGVGGQGTVLVSDVMAAAGVAAGYDVKKSDILGLPVQFDDGLTLRKRTIFNLLAGKSNGSKNECIKFCCYCLA